MIEFNNVSFSYSKSDDFIFKDLNVSFLSTGLYVILGYSGSGKSTFLSFLNKTLKPTKGTISFSSDYSFSTVFQNSLLLDYLTVIENVSLPLLLDGYSLNEAKSVALKMLEKVALVDLKDKYPKYLSGGEKIRVSIARSLIKNSTCLILDEPTGQLDEKTSSKIYKILKELSKEILIILVTHDEENANKIADHLFIIKNKKLEVVIDNKIDNLKIEKKKNKSKNIKLFESLKLFFSYLKIKRKRVILSAFFSVFSLTFLYLGLNIKNNLNNMILNVTSDYYSTDVFTIKNKEEIKSDKKITLNKFSIPSDLILNDLYIQETYYSLNYFLPEYYSLTLNKIEKTVMFLPVFNKDSNSNKFDVVINSKFKEDFNLTLKENIKVNRSVVLQSSKFENNELIDISLNFKISKVIDEISLFNQPTVYYNYFDLLSYFDTIILKNEEMTLKELILDSSFNGEDFKSQELYFISNNIDEILKYKEIKKLDNVIISNKSLEFKQTFKDIFNSIESVFLLFLIFCLINSFILEILCLSSLYEENIRLFALSKVFSDSKANSKLLIIYFGLLFFIISSVCTFLSSFAFRLIVNKILNSLNLTYFILKPDILSFFLILVLILIISLLNSLISGKRIDDSSIKKELIAEE